MNHTQHTGALRAAVAALALGWTSGAAAEDSFEVVKIVGDTNLSSGSLSADDGDTLANGAVGLFASAKFAGERRLELTVAFSFGNEGSTLEAADEADYVSFLRTPTSAVGGFIRARVLGAQTRGMRLGGTLNLRANAIDVVASDARDTISLVGIDPAGSLSVLVDSEREIAVSIDAGWSFRFWNKPSSALVAALMTSDEHFYYGPRVTAALQIGDVHVGIELTRFGGGDLDAYEEFTILPYVGLRGGLSLKEPTTDAEPTARAPSIL